MIQAPWYERNILHMMPRVGWWLFYSSSYLCNNISHCFILIDTRNFHFVKSTLIIVVSNESCNIIFYLFSCNTFNVPRKMDVEWDKSSTKDHYSLTHAKSSLKKVVWHDCKGRLFVGNQGLRERGRWRTNRSELHFMCVCVCVCVCVCANSLMKLNLLKPRE
jgi:hypothetical protein